MPSVPGIDQSNVIAGAIIIAYIVFITMRGELAIYLQLLRGGGAEVQGGGTSSPVTGNDASPLLDSAVKSLTTQTNNFLNLGGSSAGNDAGFTF